MSLTTDPNDPELGHGSDTAPVPQNAKYLVLSTEELARGFCRPVRRSYIHRKFGCGALTTMAVALAETYARDPHFYGATYCAGCRMHRPVGEHGEFTWADDEGHDTGIRVGT